MSTVITPPAELLQRAATAADEAAAVAKQRANRLSIVRLVAFFVLVAAAILLGVELHPIAGFGAVVVGLLLFNRLVGKQQALDAEHLYQQRRAELARAELAALDYDFSAFDGGVQYADPAHAYTSDLDIFGDNSVFRLINRTGSLVGTEALAYYMRHPLTDADQIQARQQAAIELGPLLDWRLGFAAYGRTADQHNPLALDRLRLWALQPAALTATWWKWVIPVLSIFNVLWLASFAYLPFYLALLGYVPTYLLLRRAKPHVDKIYEDTSTAIDLLASYRSMISAIEGHSWSSDLLRQLAKVISRKDNNRVSDALDALAGDTRQLGIRSNPYVILFNLFSFWEVRYARKLEAWKKRYTAKAAAVSIPVSAHFLLPSTASQDDGSVGSSLSALDTWLIALGAFDALSSFGAVVMRHPAWSLPQIGQSPALENAALPIESSGDHIVGKALNHPLLPPQRSVANDFSSPAHAHIALLTGSNMAGKSTFLRTVGLNIAMAQWGCPVPAEALRLPVLQVYTSMRTQDNLHEGASAFYAELQRLRFVVEATRRGENVFFLLDEILKGTNSQDRHEGGRALLRQLIRHGGAGVVATHDLELGELASETKSIRNIRLEVETDAEGKLYFDYTVKPGLAQSRNASVLMRQMGLGED